MFNRITRPFTMKKTKEETLKEHIGKNATDSKIKISNSIDEIKKKLEKDFSRCSDFVMREVEIGMINTKVIIAFFDGFVDKQILSQNVVDPIVKYSGDNEKKTVLELLKTNVISSSSLMELTTFEDTVDSIVSGEAVLYVDGESKAFKIGVKAPDKRAVEQPDTEITTKGPREGFTENLRTNTILLRRRIRNPQFKVESIKLGEETKTDIVLCYIDGIVKHEIVEEVKRRIDRIKIDGVLATGYIEQFIQDGKFPLFPMVGNSEKPDKVAAKLLEGRVAIIADGTPTVLTVPFLIIETFQIQEDYFGEYFFSSFLRILRFACFMISIYLPALYVAITSFHQTIIPFKLFLTMAAAREGIPFSAFTEALLMIITFQILSEAGIRMPRAIGQAVSIVGAIVLGEAAVSAGIASAPLVIVVALAGICSFIVPPLMKTGAILRFIILITANVLGLMGIGVASIILITYLCNKRSFGIPYMTPFSPLHTADLKDSLIVVPMWAMFSRPRALTEGQDTTRTTGKSFSKRGK
ncbi:MAG: spore germination protein [Clostridia bacterium]|nr:spore germination protein [Clostridia bacterium]